MASVRVPHSYDGYGRPTAVPPHISPAPAPWRQRRRAPVGAPRFWMLPGPHTPTARAR